MCNNIEPNPPPSLLTLSSWAERATLRRLPVDRLERGIHISGRAPPSVLELEPAVPRESQQILIICNVALSKHVIAMARLAGKRALVTGGSSGIGEPAHDVFNAGLVVDKVPGAAVVKLLVQQGARVAINYSSNQQRAAQVLDDVGGTDKGHLLIRANAFVKAEIDSMVQETVQHFGGLDLVVSNAGWTAFGDFSDLSRSRSKTPGASTDHSLDAITDDDWMECYKNNVLSHLWLMQRCEAELRQAEGSFVVSASVAGLKPSGSSMVGTSLTQPRNEADTFRPTVMSDLG